MNGLAFLGLVLGFFIQNSSQPFSGYAEMDGAGRPYATFPSTKGQLKWQKNRLIVSKEGQPWFAFEINEIPQPSEPKKWEGVYEGVFVSLPSFGQRKVITNKGSISFSTLPNGQKVAEITTVASDLTLVLFLCSY